MYRPEEKVYSRVMCTDLDLEDDVVEIHATGILGGEYRDAAAGLDLRLLPEPADLGRRLGFQRTGHEQSAALLLDAWLLGELGRLAVSGSVQRERRLLFLFLFLLLPLFSEPVG